jgi:hypothetical protein
MKTLVIFILLLAVSDAMKAQAYNELGSMSGSGLVLMPSTAIAPLSQFRVQADRIALADQGGTGMNMFEFSGGFSRLLEGYFRLTNEQLSDVQSLSGIAGGAKLTMPFEVPVLREVALWGESSTTDQVDRSTFFPLRITRTALVATPVSDGFRTSEMIGFTKKVGDSMLEPLIGADATMALGHEAEIGVEWVSGYAGKSSNDILVSGMYRILPFASIHLSPGYTAVADKSSLMFSVGISVNTADIDFKPAEGRAVDQFKMPSLDDIEKETKQENKQ